MHILPTAAFFAGAAAEESSEDIAAAYKTALWEEAAGFEYSNCR